MLNNLLQYITSYWVAIIYYFNLRCKRLVTNSYANQLYLVNVYFCMK